MITFMFPGTPPRGYPGGIREPTANDPSLARRIFSVKVPSAPRVENVNRPPRSPSSAAMTLAGAPSAPTATAAGLGPISSVSPALVVDGGNPTAIPTTNPTIPATITCFIEHFAFILESP